MSDFESGPPRVLCHDDTLGYRGPMTMSSIEGKRPFWGRVDYSVYILGGVTLLLSFATLGFWWPMVSGADPAARIASGLLFLFAPAGAVGFLCKRLGVRVRDFPRYVWIAFGVLRVQFSRPSYQGGRIQDEPRGRRVWKTWAVRLGPNGGGSSAATED